MAIVLHKKGSFAGMRAFGMAGMCRTYWEEDGWHDTETGKLVSEPRDIKLAETSPEEYLGLPKPTPVSPQADAFDKLRQLCGHIEDGSSTVVSIFQDDATRMWHIKIKFNSFCVREFYASSLAGVISKATETMENE